MRKNNKGIEVFEKHKRINDDAWICDQLEELVFKYEQYLKRDEEKELDEYEYGEHDGLLAVVAELKELLYKQ